MSLEIISRVLPGIGVCQELELHGGKRIGIVTRRNGQRDIVVYDEDGDGAAEAIQLNGDEANVLAELLGAPQLVLRLTDLQRSVDEVLTEQLPIPVTSPYDGRPLGDTQARTKTGASIVAILRDGTTHASPGPDFVLRAGDLVVTVGTREGVDHLVRILDGADAPPGTG
ncbi:MAG TPA: TrkA C-terminal domain-containing protein [Jatrophihabitantaceae bacterium]|jgi:TrkA domain protein|nr:TrkA C-terminal domain-containing protein [Jatrophihabitantaceae bacterium]